MRYLDLTCESPAMNLAFDEVLLDLCEEDTEIEVLRLWEPQHYFVVVGYGNAVEREVDIGRCRKDDVPILRRYSGGGTVLQGPGCLNFSLILPVRSSRHLAGIGETNRFIMERHRKALEILTGEKIEVEGYTDLAIEGRKFSGNAQRRKCNALMFHGTILLQFDSTMVERYLRMPSRMPSYRDNRRHRDFMRNLPGEVVHVKAALRDCWNAHGELDPLPIDDARGLADSRYKSVEWTFRR